jgi:hypothetical protein
MPDTRVYAYVWLTLSPTSSILINLGRMHMHVCMCHQPRGPVEVKQIIYNDSVRLFLLGSHNSEYNNVVWFSIRPTTHLNLTSRSPTLWMEYLYPNLTSD